MDRQYVDEFFDTGKLRLSSFASFKKHLDEEREDQQEGHNVLIHRTYENGGQTIVIPLDVGHDSYVLCGSTAASRELMAKFGCDSGLVIRDTSAFANAIASQIPGFSGGLEGCCSYSKFRLFVKDLGYLPIQPPNMPPKSRIELHPEIGEQIARQIANDDVYFTKEQRYSAQLEYRLIWRTVSPVTEFISIVAPDARQFCARFSEFDA